VSHYRSNLRDIEFNLFEVFGAQERFGAGPFSELDADTARAMLKETEKLATGILADSFADADRNLPVSHSLRRASDEGGYYHYRGGVASQLLANGQIAAAPQSERATSIEALAGAGKLVKDFGATRLWDMGQGVACLELTTKLGTILPSTLDGIDDARMHAESSFGALVIGSDNSYFSAGANLEFLLSQIEQGNFAKIKQFIDRGQKVYSSLKLSPIPIVAAISGVALGGGCELALHCSAIQAHAESKIGLVEARAGLVPAWGGCKEMLQRLSISDPAGSAAADRVFRLVAGASTSGSAYEARRMGFLRPSDGITMNRARLLSDAHERALQLMTSYVPAGARDLHLAEILSSDVSTTTQLRSIFLAPPGGAVSETEMLQREQAAFMELVVSPDTVETVKSIVR
jgi:3-hydroxyacyl-CoA dehydrogenase